MAKKPLAHYVAEALTLSWLTGPVFDKELRVSSRRKRNYVLRLVYLAALTLFMSLVWMEVVGRWERYGDSSYRTYQMSRAGVTIVMFIVWFQFIASQFVSIIMCSTSISDEVYSKTLGVLMTTPVNSMQIVLGKICSKLLQVVVLLLISLPLLATVRVLGGVPWDFLWVSLCLTLSCVLMVGSLSLFFSIFNRHAYLVIVETLVALGFLFLLLPVLAALIMDDWMDMPSRQIMQVIFLVNPYFALIVMSESAVRAWGPTFFGWETPCLVTLGTSAVPLAVSSAIVRKVALRQATGQSVSFWSGRKKRPRVSAPGAQSPAMESPGALRTVKDPPVLWKELHSPLIRSWKWRLTATLVLLGILGTTYILCASEHVFSDRETQMVYAVVMLIFAAVCTAIFSATTITAEKEARSWEILLLTDQGDWQIVLGKLAGVLRRCLPFWLILLGHVLLFSALGYIRPEAIGHIVMLSVWMLLFLGSSGILFSVFFRKTTTAVIMNLALAVVIWAVVPFVLVMTSELGRGPYGQRDKSLFEGCLNGNPVVHCIVTMEANSIRQYDYSYYGYNSNYYPPGYPPDYYDNQRTYHWPDSRRDFLDSTNLMATWGVAYLIAALVMLRLAKGRLRKRL